MTPCSNYTCPNYDADAVSECELCRTEGEPCTNGTRGEMKHGDPQDCRCFSCSACRCDAAEYLLEDR